MNYYRYTSDEDDDWMYGLVWRKLGRPVLYWSEWVGWTRNKNQALVVTNTELLNDMLREDVRQERLPVVAHGQWLPLYRKYPLYAERVIEPIDNTGEDE